MPIYLAPDLYIEEVPSGNRPIQAVGTSVAGFVGTAPKAAFLNQVIAINNWTEFTRYFVDEENLVSTPLARAVYGFFLNGGTRCYVVNVAEGESIVGGGTRRTGLDLLKEVDEVAIVAAPGYTDPVSYDALITHCEDLKDRVAILDSVPEVDNLNRLTEVAVPPTSSRSRRSKSDSESTDSSTETAIVGLKPRQSDGGYAAVYFPWLVMRDPLTGEITTAPPSGHIAGIWARTDATRGVHKAPANETVRGALDVTYRVTRQEQELLNPSGVNVIRFFTGQGILVWGARTLSPASGEFRYLNVRRLFAMIEESIAESLRWVVFEPNDQTLWKSIRRDITAFLTRLWRDGALVGSSPSQAFFVKCDAETNPPESVDAGIVVTVIGIAPVKPAEFVVFRISQYAPGSEIE